MSTIEPSTLVAQRRNLAYLSVLYPLWMACGIFSLMYVTSTLIVLNDVATTSSNIANSALLFRLGTAGSLLTQLIFIFAALFLYRLFAPIDKYPSALMVIFALLAVPIAMLNAVYQAAVVLLNSGAEYLQVFSPEQQRAVAMFFIE